MATMKVSQVLPKMMETFEGNRLRAYDDAQPNVNITDESQIKGTLTIGRGHTGPDVYVGQVITEDESLRLFYQDIAEAEAEVKKYVTVPLRQCEYDSTVDGFFNIGPGGPSRDGLGRLKSGAPSTFLNRLNAGEYERAADALMMWFRTSGLEYGLLKRCTARTMLFKGLPWEDAVSEISKGLVGLLLSGSPLSMAITKVTNAAFNQQVTEKFSTPPPQTTPAKPPPEETPEPPEEVAFSLPEPEPVETPVASPEPVVMAPKPEPKEAKQVTIPDLTTPIIPVGTKPKSPLSMTFEELGLDPNLQVKSIDESKRVDGLMWQRGGVVVIRLGAMGAFGSTFKGVSEFVGADAQTFQTFLMVGQELIWPLFVTGGLAAAGWVQHQYGTWMRKKGESEGSQALG